MNNYKVTIINWNIENIKNRMNSIKTFYTTGLRQARQHCPATMHYSYNVKCFVGYKDNFEYWIEKI